MDVSGSDRATDVLGRRNGPRRRYSLAEKRAIVEQTQERGASVPEVAQRHGINPNLVFGWRRLYQQGLMNPEVASNAVPLLPVKLESPTLVPGNPAPSKPRGRPRRRDRDGTIEIEFAAGVRLLVRGNVDQTVLERVIAVLSNR